MSDIEVQTKIEKKLGVTVVNPAYPPGDVRRYGATDNMKAIDDAQAVNRAMNPVLTNEETLRAWMKDCDDHIESGVSTDLVAVCPTALREACRELLERRVEVEKYKAWAASCAEPKCDATWQPIVDGPVIQCTLPNGHSGKHLAGETEKCYVVIGRYRHCTKPLGHDGEHDDLSVNRT